MYAFVCAGRVGSAPARSTKQCCYLVVCCDVPPVEVDAEY